MRLSNVLLTVAIAGLSGQAYAATACVNGTLADYELLGTGGHRIAQRLKRRGGFE